MTTHGTLPKAATGINLDGIGDFIRAQLTKQRIAFEDKGDHLMVCCPFHDDKSPSMKMNTASRTTDSGYTYLPGDYKCLGCGVHGNWNVMATRIKGDKLDLTEIKAFAGASTTLKTYDDRLDQHESVHAYLQAYKLEGYQPWPDGDAYGLFKDWRGVSGETMRKIDAYLMFEKREIRAFLPVKVNGMMAGGVKAALTSDTFEKKYLTTPGGWVNEKGVFLYDYSSDLALRLKKKYLLVVEGPRDALRLIERDIPAVAILGVGTVNRKKMKLIGTMLPDTKCFFTLPDNDKAGQVLAEKALDLREYAPVFNLVLPAPDSAEAAAYEGGKIDPFNASDELLDRVLRRADKKLRELGTCL